MYIKFIDYNGQVLEEGDSVLMSHDEFVNGGKNLKGVPLTITPDGSEPVEMDEIRGIEQAL